MKFTGALSTLLVVLPFLVLQASAAPSISLEARQRDNGRRQGGNNRNGNKQGQKGQAGKGTAAAANATAASTSAAATASAAAGTGAANSTAAAGTGAAANGTAAAGGDPQTSLTLDPSVIGPNLAQNGQGGAGSTLGQAPSATSTNNFINSCIGKTITNGLQNQAGSCNPVPMGDIPSKTNQPACKFQFPTNLANIAENTAFTVEMAIEGMETGAFVNPNTNYFAAPQALNAQGQIVGHSHFVIQLLPSITSTSPLDPTVFAFFQGLNAAAQGGVLSASVTKGLPAGTYRVFSINTAANHQPVIGPVAQHGSFDDAVYFTVGNAAAQAAQTAIGGAAAAGNGTAAAAPAAPPAASNATAPAAPPAAGNATAPAASAAPPAAGKATAAASSASAAATGAAKGNVGGNTRGGRGRQGGRRSFVIAH